MGRSFEFEGNRPIGTLRTDGFSLVGLLEHSKTGKELPQNLKVMKDVPTDLSITLYKV